MLHFINVLAFYVATLFLIPAPYGHQALARMIPKYKDQVNNVWPQNEGKPKQHERKFSWAQEVFISLLCSDYSEFEDTLRPLFSQ